MTAIKRLFLLLFLVTLTSACDSGGSDDGDSNINVNDTASLAGTYDLVSITSKSDESFGVGTVITAGEVNSFDVPFDGGSIPVVMEISATVTFTTTSFSTNVASTITFFGETQSDVDQESGTYTVSNSQMTTTSSAADPEDGFIGSGTFSLAASGMDLTMDNAEASMLLRKR